MKKILVAGGCGYQGSVLIPKLLKLNYKVISVDTKWFGDFLPKHKNLLNIKCNISNIEKIPMKNVQVIIHLASIANDTMSELDKNLSWETSALGTMKLINLAIKNRVKKIIYASSGSVYGIKKEKNVIEESKLEPISLYNQVKMITERVLLSFKDNDENSNDSSSETDVKEEPIEEQSNVLFDIKSLNGIEDKMIRGSAKKIYMAGKRAKKSSAEVVDDILNELSDKMDDKTKELIGGLK